MEYKNSYFVYGEFLCVAFMCEDQGRDYLYKNTQADRNEICQADIIFYFILSSEITENISAIKVVSIYSEMIW